MRKEMRSTMGNGMRNRIKNRVGMLAAVAMVLTLAACSSNTGSSQAGSSPAGSSSEGSRAAGSSTGNLENAGNQASQTVIKADADAAAAESPNPPETIVVNTLNGNRDTVEIEVLFNPKRAAVMDMAVLDMLDSWDLGDRVVGMPKSSKIDYLMKYNENEAITNLGTLKEVDMEALMEVQPEIIFIGGRLSDQYDTLSEIAPVVFISNDYEKGIVQSVKDNAVNVASIFGLEEQAREQTAAFDTRIAALAEKTEGKTAVIGMVTSSGFSTLGNRSRGSLIGTEAGFTNLAEDVDSTHGNESSFELLVKSDPDYIFVLDRDQAVSTEGAKLAQEVMENELVKKTRAYKNGTIVYLNPSVWYLAEGGIKAMDVMLDDLEGGMKEE